MNFSVPKGTCENSPRFQPWDQAPKMIESRRDDRGARTFQPSLQDSRALNWGPNVKTLGYFRISLRDKKLLRCSAHPGHSNPGGICRPRPQKRPNWLRPGISAPLVNLTPVRMIYFVAALGGAFRRFLSWPAWGSWHSVQAFCKAFACPFTFARSFSSWHSKQTWRLSLMSKPGSLD